MRGLLPYLRDTIDRGGRQSKPAGTGDTIEGPKERKQQQDDGPESAQARRRRTPLTPDFELREVRKGLKPGDRYIRITPRSKLPFHRAGEDEYRATDVALQPRSRNERFWRRLKRVAFGPILPTSGLAEERLTKLKALAVFSSNNLSSSAYATEEILLILILAGAGVFSASIPIALAIVALVAIVALSYSQVIRAYPGGGGSYVVAKENLGMSAGLVAGASLIVDYTLTVAVSISAGVAAITSAVPEIRNERVLLAVLLVGALTLANLRGLRESGTLFAIPTYFFILSFASLMVTGLVRLALGHDLSTGTPPDVIEEGSQALGLFLILRAFSAGSAALTGIEAVSNGVPSFKPPEARNANVTLAWMAVILGVFFLGMTTLAFQLDVVPSDTKTVVAQVAEGVFGKSPFFYIVQIATMLILILAANTSFVGLPALASVMARDRVLPEQFAFRGDRLAFSNGIIVLGLASVGLLVVYQADTHALIPLYAVGVFIGFTLSQTGLALRWHRDVSPGSNRSLVINALGAAATGVVAVIITITKFVDGAWITLAAIGVLTFFFSRIYYHYRRVAEQLEVPRAAVPPLPSDELGRERAVIVPVDELNQATLRSLEYARSISDNVLAIHITDQMEEGEQLRRRWEEVDSDTPMIIIESPYRSFVAPMLTYIDALDRTVPDAPITVVLPEFVPAHVWEGLLHNQLAIRLKRALLHRPNTVVIDVPYQLRP